MKALRVSSVVFALALLAAAPPRTPIYGFLPDASNAERQFESQFLDIPSAPGMYAHAQRIAQTVHPAASDGDKTLATYVCETMRAYGLACEIEAYSAPVDVPQRVQLQVVASPTPLPSGAPRSRPPGPVTLDLREPAIDGDPATADPKIPLPVVQGSGNGDVRAPIVYAAHGREADYQQLQEHGVLISGAVLLVRLGAQPAPELVARAQAQGAAAILLYADPAEDGAARGPTYPDGPWRPAASVRRAYAGTGVKVPVLAISAANARLLLATLAGPDGPNGWAGGLPVAYPLARGPGIAHVTVRLRRSARTLYNTVTTIPGRKPEGTVVLGASRDAWVYGVNLNGAGTATVLEVARGLGYLTRNGWKPARTIVLGTWDGGAVGGSGVRAFATRHPAAMQSAIAYLDADRAVVGPRFAADAAALLGSSVVDTVREISSPTDMRISIFDEWVRAEKTPAPPIAIPAGPSAADPFFYGLGIPSAHLAFTGPFGVADSAYDTLRYADRYSDPNFTIHKAGAQSYGLLTMRLANADAIPYRFTSVVALMRASLAQVADRARTTNVASNLAPLEPAIAAFNAAALRFDASTARAANATRGAQALAAARALDLGIHSAAGYDGVTFAPLARAVGAGDANATDQAVAAIVDLLQRSTALLAT